MQPISDPSGTLSQSYARIRNPRSLLVIRVLTTLLFTTTTCIGLLSLPAAFLDIRNSITSDAPTLAYLSSLGISVDAAASYNFALTLVANVLWTAAGLVIFFFRSDDWVAIITSSYFVLEGIASNALSHTVPLFVGLLSVVQAVCGWMPIFLILCLFPNGRFVPRWSRWLVPFYVIVCAPIVYSNFVTWTTGITPDSNMYAIAPFILFVFWILGIIFLFYRLRRTENPIQRQQIKQMTAGTLIIASTSLILLILPLVPVIGTSALANVIVKPLILNLGILGFVLFQTFSILRYRLWDIDLVLNRGIVYGGLVILLIMVFVGVLLLLDTALRTILGSEQTTLSAMVATGVTIALFNVSRLKLQSLVDKQLFGLRIGLNQIGLAKSDYKSAEVTSEAGHSGLIGKPLGTYQVLSLLGQGGMGEIYLGNQPSLNRQVALKVLLPHYSHNTEFRSRFEREARTAANLHHKNIVGVLDFGESQGVYFMAMEYIQGQDLGSYMREKKVLPLQEVILLISEIVSALDYAHQQGIVHRDIKPSNIMLRKQPHLAQPLPMLTDFGLTKLVDSSSDLTQSGPIGTLAYMAPEQITSSRSVDHRADIYATGVMCYQMLTGSLPFPTSSQPALLFAHLHRPAPDPRLINQAIPSHVALAILGALAKNPAKRPKTAGEFAVNLSASRVKP